MVAWLKFMSQSAQRERLEIASPTVAELKSAWAQIDRHSCPRHYNFHMHTVYSDGRLTPKALVQQVLDIGLTGFAITDHHSVGGYLKARTLIPTNGPRLWSGLEITADLLGVEVHILGYGFDPHHVALNPYLKGDRPAKHHKAASKAIAALHAAGGLTVLAHPFRYRRSAEELVPAAVEAGIDGIEAYYSYKNPKPWAPTPIKTDRALELAEIHHLAVTCGTDTHGLSLLQRV